MAFCERFKEGLRVDILPGRADTLNTAQVNLRNINIQEIKALKHLLTVDLSTLSRLGLFNESIKVVKPYQRLW